MNANASFLRLFLAAAIAVVVGVEPLCAEVIQGRAVVQSVKGSAMSTTPSGAWQQIRVGQVLQAGTVLKTGPDSVVDLHLGQNGPAVRLVSNTTLSLDRLTYEARGGETVIDTQMDVRTGAILGNARKLAEASRYEVKTLIGVAGIRGTEFFLSAAGVLHVLSGAVDLAVVVAAPDGQVAGNLVTVAAGQSFVPPSTLNSATISSLISSPTLPEVTAEILGLMPAVAPEVVSAPLIQDMNRDVQVHNPKVELISN